MYVLMYFSSIVKTRSTSSRIGRSSLYLASAKSNPSFLSSCGQTLRPSQSASMTIPQKFFLSMCNCKRIYSVKYNSYLASVLSVFISRHLPVHTCAGKKLSQSFTCLFQPQKQHRQLLRQQRNEPTKFRKGSSKESSTCGVRSASARPSCARMV